jgi:hypothetical protein
MLRHIVTKERIIKRLYHQPHIRSTEMGNVCKASDIFSDVLDTAASKN